MDAYVQKCDWRTFRQPLAQCDGQDASCNAAAGAHLSPQKMPRRAHLGGHHPGNPLDPATTVEETKATRRS